MFVYIYTFPLFRPPTPTIVRKHLAYIYQIIAVRVGSYAVYGVYSCVYTACADGKHVCVNKGDSDGKYMLVNTEHVNYTPRLHTKNSDSDDVYGVHTPVFTVYTP